MRSSKTSFVLQTSHIHILEQLSDEQAGKLIKAVFAYEAGGEIPSFSDPLLTGFFFGCFKPFMDEAAAKYAAKCQKNAANAAKRYECKTDNVPVTNGNERMQSDAIAYDGCRYDMNRYDMNRYDSKKEESKEERAVLPSEQAISKYQDVISFYQENIDPLMSSFVASNIASDCEEYGKENMMAAIEKAKLSGIRKYAYIRATAKGMLSDAVNGPSDFIKAKQAAANKNKMTDDEAQAKFGMSAAEVAAWFKEMESM